MPSSCRIDVHFHLIPSFYSDAVYAAGRGPAIGKYPDWTPELALELMDAHGIEVALTSLGQPGVGFGGPAEGDAMARRVNDYASELCARWPKRFGAFGTVPVGTIDGALAETARCLDTLKHDGVSLFTTYHDKFLGDRLFDPLMEFLDARAAVVFVHPGLRISSKNLARPWPDFMMEYPFDTTRAAVNLIFSGTLDRFPHITFILPHAGGVLPYLAWRLSVSPMIDKRMPQLTQAQVFAALRRFWYDNALAPGDVTFGALDNVALPERIVFGTDFPFANPRVIAEAVKTHEARDLSEARRAAIDRGNALKLFPKYG